MRRQTHANFTNAFEQCGVIAALIAFFSINYNTACRFRKFLGSLGIDNHSRLKIAVSICSSAFGYFFLGRSPRRQASRTWRAFARCLAGVGASGQALRSKSSPASVPLCTRCHANKYECPPAVGFPLQSLPRPPTIAPDITLATYTLSKNQQFE
jgi:cytochrome c553